MNIRRALAVAAVTGGLLVGGSVLAAPADAAVMSGCAGSNFQLFGSATAFCFTGTGNSPAKTIYINIHSYCNYGDRVDIYYTGPSGGQVMTYAVNADGCGHIPGYPIFDVIGFSIA